MSRPALKSVLTVREIAQAEKVKQDTVLAWIHSGQLKARDVAPNRKPGGRPSWRIDPDDYAAFTRARAAKPAAAPAERKRRTRTPDVIEFFS